MFGSNKKVLLTTEQQSKDAGRMLETVSPLVNTLYSHQALFVINKGLNHVTVIFFYLLGLASFAFAMIMNTVFPFHILGEIISKRVYEAAMTSKGEIETFNIAVKALVIIIGLLFIFIGILISKAGKHKTMLQQTGKALKSVEEYFLKIKEAETVSIEQINEEGQ